MRDAHAHGHSIVETLVALALVASVSAALLPAVSIAARLQRDSAIETQAVVMAAGRMELLKADLAARRTGPGGALDAAFAGYYTHLDRDGTDAPVAAAVFECRWRVAAAAAPSGMLILSVRVVPLADALAAVTISTTVPDG